jgi:hypothetical protein
VSGQASSRWAGTIDAAIDEACRTLHLPTIRDRYHQIATDALREHASHKRFLAELLGCEVADRCWAAQARAAQRSTAARHR